MMKKFKELMRKPITWGDCFKCIFWGTLGSLAIVAGFVAGILRWIGSKGEKKPEKIKKEKKGYTKIKLDDLPDDDGINIEEVFSWD